MKYDKIYAISSKSDIYVEVCPYHEIRLPDQEKINQYWEEMKTNKPSLFDGRVLYGRIMNKKIISIKLYPIYFRELVYLLDHDFVPPNEGKMGFKTLIHNNTSILAGKRHTNVSHLPGYWTSVGGIFDHHNNDFIEETIYREIREETSRNLSNFPINYHYLGIEDGIGIDLVTSIYVDQPLEHFGFRSNEEFDGDFEILKIGNLNSLNRNFTQEFRLINDIVSNKN